MGGGWIPAARFDRDEKYEKENIWNCGSSMRKQYSGSRLRWKKSGRDIAGTEQRDNVGTGK